MQHTSCRAAVAAISLALALSACDGNTRSTPAGLSCTALSPLVSAANIDTVCNGNCNVEQPKAIADGDFGSATVFRFESGGSGTLAANVKASGGGMFAAGSRVGVIWQAAEATEAGVVYQLNTYLAGTMQDSFVLGLNGQGSAARPEAHSTQTTTRPYDTVEFKYVRGSGSTGGAATVYELCSD